MKRDRWEMAKCHMASSNNNDMTMRYHLGFLHFASAPFTTAFVNLAKEDKSLKWIKEEFIDIFSQGMLQANYVGSVTLVDHKSPLLSRIFYLKPPQIGHIVNKLHS